MAHPLNAFLEGEVVKQESQYTDPKKEADRLDFLESIRIQRALISRTKEVVKLNLRNFEN